ncbi:MAG: 4Fe-4S binding protein [Chloroflexi bacterium]|nr:4Fe-4S binding protein [Chloroflexota bacterium]
MSVTKIGTMFGDVVNGLFKKPATNLYPFERRETPERLRGHVVWEPSLCTGCGLCAKDCPSNALDVIVLDRKAKRFVLRYRLDQCTYCAQCVASCRQGAISLAYDQWELAALTRESFLSIYGDPDDIAEALAAEAGEQTDEA